MSAIRPATLSASLIRTSPQFGLGRGRAGDERQRLPPIPGLREYRRARSALHQQLQLAAGLAAASPHGPYRRRRLYLVEAYDYQLRRSSERRFASTATNSYDLKQDYGPSTANTPQIFIANYIYDLPFFKGQHGLEGKLLGGWEVSGITQFVSGQSFSVLQPWDPFDPDAVNAGLGLGATRPDQVSAVHMTKTVDQWFTPDSFARANGHFGSESSNSLLGPGLQNWDLAAIKNIALAERYKFQLRGEFFNAFNHTNFETVDNSLDDGSFGAVTAAHVPRRIQLGAKFYF